MITKDLIFGAGSYAQGANTLTSFAPKADGHIDRNYPDFIKTIREQLNWINVNDTNIQAIASSLTAKTMGVSINTQVESQSQKFNIEAERFIKKHGSFGVEGSDISALGELTGKHHFNSFARQVSDFTLLNGGIIVRHHYNTNWDMWYKYELVGVDMIDINKSRYTFEKDKGETTINGLVRDKYGKITHVWIYKTPDKRQSEKVPYNELTYFSEVWMNIDQQAAVSKLVTILKTLDQATQYGEAELQSAIEEAKAGHYIKSTAYNEIMRVVAEEVQKVSTGTGMERIKGVKDLVTPILQDMANLGLKERGLTPIPAGDDISFNNAKKDSQYKDLTNNSEKKISSALGLSDIGTYSKAADANYSSIKYTLETDQRTADIRFEEICNKVFYEINTRIIRVGIQMGEISERVAYFKNPNKYNLFRYLRQNKIDTEPNKNAVANKTNIELGIKTKGQIVEEATGIPYEVFLKKKFEQNKLEIEYEAKLEALRRDKLNLGVTSEK